MSAYEHPIVRVAQNILEPAPDGALIVKDDGLDLLKFGLRKYADDPEIAEVVLVLYELAAALIEKAKSPEAAIKILECVVETKSEIPVLVEARKQRASAQLAAAQTRTAPKIDTPAPTGAIKASTLRDPGMQVPRSMRR